MKNSLTPALSKLPDLSKILTGDAAILLGILILFFIYAIYSGRSRIISIILAYYPATLLFHTIPFIEKLVVLEGPTMVLLNKLAVFFVLYIPLNMIIYKYVFALDRGSSNFVSSGRLALATLILVLLFSYTTVNLDIIHNFSPIVDSFFQGSVRTFLWNLAPLALMALL